MIRHFNSWPKSLESCAVEELDTILGGPALIKIAGRGAQPLVVSTLLHGNEHSGFYALQRLMKETQGQELPRPLWIFIGNTRAAAQNIRLLPDQPDYNRIWSGGTGKIFEAATELLKELKSVKPFACIDIHDNTGWNPHYACISNLSNPSLQLASLFNHFAIQSTFPCSTLTFNAARIAPAVTLECGRAGDPKGAERALRYIQAVLHLTEFSGHPPRPQDFKLYRSAGRIMIAPKAPIIVGDAPAPEGGLSLRPDLDHLNFSPLEVGTHLGLCSTSEAIFEECGEGASGGSQATPSRFIAVKDNHIVVIRPFIPAMLSLKIEAIRSDCLGYFMEEISIN